MGKGHGGEFITLRVKCGILGGLFFFMVFWDGAEHARIAFSLFLVFFE